MYLIANITAKGLLSGASQQTLQINLQASLHSPLSKTSIHLVTHQPSMTLYLTEKVYT